MNSMMGEMSGNRLPPPQQKLLTPGSVMEINGQSSFDGAFALMSGAAETIVEISMGEPTAASPPDAQGQKLHLMHITNPQDADFVALASRAQKAGTPVSSYVLAATNQRGMIQGMAYLPTPERVSGRIVIPAASSYDVGRSGTLSWLDFGAQTQRKPGWTPFRQNARVARKQLAIAGDGRGNFQLLGLETQSRTEIRAAEVNVVFDGQKSRAKTEVIGVPPAPPKLGRLALWKARKSSKKH